MAGYKMNLLNRITNDAIQKFRITTDEGEAFDLILRYIPTQQGWLFSIESDDFNLKGARLGDSVNILRQYQNKISYGLMCDGLDGLDPSTIDDFVNGRAEIFILSRAEVLEIEETFFT